MLLVASALCIIFSRSATSTHQQKVAPTTIEQKRRHRSRGRGQQIYVPAEGLAFTSRSAAKPHLSCVSRTSYSAKSTTGLLPFQDLSLPAGERLSGVGGHHKSLFCLGKSLRAYDQADYAADKSLGPCEACHNSITSEYASTFLTYYHRPFDVFTQPRPFLFPQRP